MFSDVGPMELVTIAVIGVLVFGPDRLPEFLQNAARTVRKIREFSESAQDEVRSELGPEFQDFDVRDLHPKTFVRKHLLNADTEIGRELGDIRDALDPRQELAEAVDTVRDAATATATGGSGAAPAVEPAMEPAVEPAVSLAKPSTGRDRAPVAFDLDAT
ncbi:sec-independent translocase [Streptomyces fractus]|uniref:sec-independent translocase n=1 Tax=Streptomyces fractus TaxID=641806 RepID=UPI003CEC2DEF